MEWWWRKRERLRLEEEARVAAERFRERLQETAKETDERLRREKAEREAEERVNEQLRQIRIHTGGVFREAFRQQDQPLPKVLLRHFSDLRHEVFAAALVEYVEPFVTEEGIRGLIVTFSAGERCPSVRIPSYDVRYDYCGLDHAYPGDVLLFSVHGQSLFLTVSELSRPEVLWLPPDSEVLAKLKRKG